MKKMLLSPTKKAKLWISRTTRMLRTQTSKFTTSMEELTSNGISSMLMNGRVNQAKVSSMKNSVSMLKDHSISSLNSMITDILISLTTETW